jgi:hypothetical protein
MRIFMNPSMPRHPLENVKKELKRVLTEEKKRCNPDKYMIPFEWYREESPHAYSQAFILLQNAVKDMFYTLVSRDLISTNGLLQPLDLSTYHAEVAELTSILPLQSSAVSNALWRISLSRRLVTTRSVVPS